VYLDKEKQRETTRLRVRRYRDKLKGVTEKVDNVTPCVTPIIKTKADAVEAVQKISKDWRTPKVVDVGGLVKIPNLLKIGALLQVIRDNKLDFRG
jgi:hypothetical protein